MFSPSALLWKQGENCYDQHVGLHRLWQEKPKRQQVHLPKPFNGFSGCLVVFTWFFHCCWAVCVFLCLISPNSPLVHLSLLPHRLGRSSCQILTSPSAVPLPTAHSFLYYKHNACPRNGGRREPLLSLPVFFPRIGWYSFPQHSWERQETLHKINFPPKRLLKRELFDFALKKAHCNRRHKPKSSEGLPSLMSWIVQGIGCSPEGWRELCVPDRAQ